MWEGGCNVWGVDCILLCGGYVPPGIIENYNWINMKKIVFYVMAAAMVLGTASCEKINDLVTGKTTNEQGLTDDKGKKLTADEQKSKIDETADALMTDLDMSVWQKEYDTVEGVLDEMGEKKIDSSVLENKMQTIVDAWQTVKGENPFVTTTTLIKLTDLMGHFTENAEGGFDYEEANDLQITIFSGEKAITAGFSAKLTDTVINIDESYRGSQDADGNWTEKYENIVKAYVPGEAALTLKVNGELLASLNIRINYTDVNGDGWVDENDKADLGFTIKVGAYTIQLDQADYASDKASVGAKILKDNHLVVGVSAKAAYKVVETEEGIIPISGEVKVDVEGKIQVVGNLPSYDTLMTAGDKVNKASQAEDYDAFTAAVAELEKAYGFGVYYDGKNTLQATVGLEPYKFDEAGKDYNGDGVVNEQDRVKGFGVNPVIRFQDGTSYGVEEYFSEDRFGDTEQKVYKWAMDILEALGLMSQDGVVAE